MNVTIIGVAGFLGNTLAKQFAEEGSSVTGYDIVKPRNLDHKVSFRQLDVLNGDIEILPKTDAVFYLAQSPYYRIFPESANHLFGVNTFAAIRAADAAHKQGVRFFCYASAGNVYAPSFELLNEKHPVRRDDAYALSKLMAEDALYLLKDFITIMSVRFFGIFGPGQGRMLPTKIIEAVKNGKAIYLEASPLDQKDKGGLRVSFSYSIDVASCMVRLAELAVQGASLPSRLNVAGPEMISLKRFAETAGSILGKKPVFEVTDQPREFDLIADISLLQSLVKPTFTPFEEAMTMTYGSS